MGFDDVDQLLTLELSVDHRDGLRLGDRSLERVLDTLAPMPGHRIRLVNFFHNESRRAQREIRDGMAALHRSHTEELASAREQERQVGLRRAEVLEVEARRARLAAEEAQRSSEAAAESAATVVLRLGLQGTSEKVKQRMVQGLMQTVFDELMLPVLKAWAAEATSSRKQRNKTKKFLGRLMNRALSRSWNHWAELGATRTRLKRVAKRLTAGRGMVLAWTKWCSVCDAVMRLKRVAKRLTTGRGMVLAWTKWCAVCDAATECKELLELLKQVARRLASGALGKAWSSWSYYCAAYNEAMRTIRNVVAMWQGRWEVLISQ